MKSIAFGPESVTTFGILFVSSMTLDASEPSAKQNKTRNIMGCFAMRKLLLATCLGAVATFVAGAANANDALNQMAQDPKGWVMPAGDYANTRYSKLNQITAANVGKLQVAWTFSTGVLRGHEGGPLIIGNMMYVH